MTNETNSNLQANHDAAVAKLIALGLTWDEVAALFGLPDDAKLQ